MRRIGLIGGTGRVSTLDYYRILNETAARRLGGHHGADLVLRSVDLQPLLDSLSDPASIAATLDGAVDDVLRAGAEVIAFTSVTAHHFGHAVEGRADVELVHIADATGPALAGARRVGVLGTGITLANAELVARLVGTATPVLPPPADIARLDGVVFGELMHAGLSDGSRDTLAAIVDDLGARDVDRVLLACTELTFARPRLPDRSLLEDATRVHCEAIVAAAIGEVAIGEASP